MPDAMLLSPGPPPLSLLAADCAIDLIDFMAATVRGVDLLDVTPAVREAWRAHLAEYYPMLGPADRYWFASAPMTLSTIQGTWESLPQPFRDGYRQAWANALPNLLQLVGPAFQQAAPAPAAAPPVQPLPTMSQTIDAQIAPAPTPQPPLATLEAQAGPEASAMAQLQQQNANTAMLTSMSRMMANNTINLMHSWS